MTGVILPAAGGAVEDEQTMRTGRLAMQTAVDIIRREHRAITAVLSGLEYLARDLAAGGEPDYELLTVMLDYIEAFPDRLHHPKEDRYLFGALRARCAEAGPILDELEEEHRRGDALTRELRYLLGRCRVGGVAAREAFAAAVDRYVAFHWSHMRREEEHVLPLALATLTERDWTDIEAAFRANEDPVSGVAPWGEFEALFRLIVRLAPPPVGVGPTVDERRRLR
jgi:hemerythrin-like domain-containing protein